MISQSSRRAQKKYRDANPDRIRAKYRRYQMRRCYGLSPGDVAAMLDEQGGRCAICHLELNETPRVDHDHTSNKIRGLLCNLCNVAIAHFRDNAPAMVRGAAYIMAGGFEYRSIGVRFVPDPEYLAKRNGPRRKRNRK